jgi:hypothetical protein
MQRNDMKIKISLIILCLFLTLLGTSCAERTQTVEQPTPTSTNVFAISSTSTSTPTPSTVLYPTATSALQILTDSQTELVFLTLEDESCQLPCYLGITPGKTPLGSATQKLDAMGATFIGKSEHVYEDGKIYNYAYSLHIQKPAGNIGQHIDLYVSNGEIFRMSVEILGGSSNPLVFEHWHRYSIPSVLQKFGVPDAVDSEGQNSVWVLYNEIGFYIGNSGVDREANIVCPGFQEDGTSNAYLVLFDPQAKDLLTVSSVFDYIFAFSFVNGRLQKEPRISNSLPVEVFLGITAEQFYKQMMADPNACFERVNVEP